MKQKLLDIIMTAVLALSLAGCGSAEKTEAEPTATETQIQTSQQETAETQDEAASDKTDLGLNAESKPASEYTIASNDAVYALLDFSDTDEYENATKGLIASPDSLELTRDDGATIWSQDAYTFVEGDSPSTANPSLWHMTQLNHQYGLFEVCSGIYQVRGYDMSNITFIEGNTGWIVMDPLMTVECAQAALELVNENLGERPIKAVIYSHSHVDHYGGVKGIISEEEVSAESIPIIAPEDFDEHVVSENVYAGSAMARRASYQYGSLLEKNETGALCIGIGMGQSNGTPSYIPSNTQITETGQSLEVDGVEMVFQLTPGTEAPAEMNLWLPDKNALWMAENCTGTLHNLYTLRGAQVRDGNAWAEYIMEALALYGDQVEVVFQSHNWPHWGNETINTYMLNTAAMYKYINDQTLLYINEGYTETEIANMIELPEEMEKVWYTRQYYGTVAHDAKAVYEKYMGWYDASPIHLAELDPTEYAQKLVEYLGDTDTVLAKAKADYEEGEYQWVAQITNALVYADPNNMDARYLCADALEQLGYQAESGTWRNAYLCAAQELRSGTNTDPATRVQSGGTQSAMNAHMILEYLGICVDTLKIQDLSFTARIVIPEEGTYTLIVKNGILLYQKGDICNDPDTIWTTSRLGLLAVASGSIDGIQQEGERSYLETLAAAMTDFSKYEFFSIIEP